MSIKCLNSDSMPAFTLLFLEKKILGFHGGDHYFLDRDLRHQLWFCFMLNGSHLFSVQVILCQYGVVFYELLHKAD